MYPEERIKQNRKRIVEAAKKNFEISGLDAVRMEDIARDAGLTVKTITNHFSSKMDLAFAVLQGLLDGACRRLSRLTSGAAYRALKGLDQVLLLAGSARKQLNASNRQAVLINEIGNAAYVRGVQEEFLRCLEEYYMQMEASLNRALEKGVADGSVSDRMDSVTEAQCLVSEIGTGVLGPMGILLASRRAGTCDADCESRRRLEILSRYLSGGRAAAESEPVDSPTGRNLLIVDDQEINRRILRGILQAEYTLLEASNGREALEILHRKDTEISAVILDLIMPELDGFGVLRAMQQDARLAGIPVIVATQADGTESEVQALALGAEDFIPKPYQPPIIRQRLFNLIRMREATETVDELEHDRLTGLLNKDAFYREILLTAGNTTGSYDIVAANIERFKLINDTYGMREGDKLLRHLANRLRILTRDTEALCARFTGDRFYMLIRREKGQTERILRQVAEDLEKYPLNMKVVINFGIYQVEDLTVSAPAMCDRAELAVSAAKGKYDTLFTYYDDTIRRQMVLEQTILGGMERALREEQFCVYLQPKYDLQTGRVAGAEALVRWIHPECGFMSPGDFIPIFEKNGFITKLDIYVWQCVCRTLARWKRERGVCIPVSVNVSRKDIYDEHLVDTLEELIASNGLARRDLHLEITETAYTEDPRQLIGVISRLKALGYVIEMDDFGSGYSSLNMVSELPIDVLKLDMRFIQNQRRRNGRNVLYFVIGLAKWMNLLVVAEGVENQEQIEVLKKMDCNYVQGFFYARPMPMEEIEQLLQPNNLLTAAGESDTEEETVQERPNDSANHTVLVVDPQRWTRELVCDYLGERYRVAVTGSGEAAWKYMCSRPEAVSAVVADMEAGGMGADVLLRQMAQTDVCRDIPVIVTATLGTGAEADALRLGAMDYIEKPYTRDNILQRVQSVIQHRQKQQRREDALRKEIAYYEDKSRRDLQTGLFNRIELERRTEEILCRDRNTRVALIMLDIDNFKRINDRYGHSLGDEVLINVSKILTWHFGKRAVIGRTGGDEFGVLMATVDSAAVENELQTLSKKLNFFTDDVPVTCSFGACFCPACGRDFQTLYKNADLALLASKRLGKNRYKVFENSMDIPPYTLLRDTDWLLEESDDGIFVCDADNYELYYMNQALLRQLGKTREECYGKKCYQALWGLDSPCTYCLARNEMTEDFVEYPIEPAGLNRTFMLKSKLIHWGERVGKFHNLRDITQSEISREQLQRQAEESNRLLERIPGFFFCIRVNGERQPEYVSENAASLLGYTPEAFRKLLHRCAEKLIRPADRAGMEALLQAPDGLTAVHCCLIRGDGSDCPVEIRARVITDPDGSRSVFAMVVLTTVS